MSAELRVLSSEASSAGGEVIPASRVVLAVGHSSRAMYETLRAKGIALSPKPFALGLRVEHPQALIDTIQYGQEYAAGLPSGPSMLQSHQETIICLVTGIMRMYCECG